MWCALAVQVFDLGPKGTDACKKVAEVDFMEAACKASYSGGAQQVFRPGGDKQACAVKHITPIREYASANAEIKRALSLQTSKLHVPNALQAPVGSSA